MFYNVKVMARRAERDKARILRSQGKSYSEIRDVLGVGKGTLSAWLHDMPLSTEQIRSLRDWNPRRIENYRATVERRRNARLDGVYQKVRRDIGKFTKRELFIAGLFLYWGEGSKSTKGSVSVSNTDPHVIHFFLNWLNVLDVPREKLKVKLHLYSDMDIQSEMCHWSEELQIPLSQFRKPYVKTSLFSGLTYKKGYGHGTCNVYFENMALWEYIMMALKYLGEPYTRP